MKTDLVTQNVAMKVDRPKKNDYQPVFLDAEELQHLFEVVKGTKLELPVLVATFYGLRRGEVCGLKWDAIDFERGTITIRHTVTSLQVDGKTKMYAQDSAKTKSSMRTLPLVGSFAEYFKEVRAAQEVNKKVCGNCYNYEYDGYVFVDELGDLMRPVFQRLMNNSVIVNDRVWLDCFQLFGIELLNVSCLQTLKRYRFLSEIRLNHRFHHLFVRAECGRLNTHLDDFQPFEQIVCKRHIGSKLADFLRRYKFTSDSCKLGFGFAFVSPFGQSRGKVFHTAFSVVVIVA